MHKYEYRNNNCDFKGCSIQRINPIGISIDFEEEPQLQPDQNGVHNAYTLNYQITMPFVKIPLLFDKFTSALFHHYD